MRRYLFQSEIKTTKDEEETSFRQRKAAIVGRFVLEHFLRRKFVDYVKLL